MDRPSLSRKIVYMKPVIREWSSDELAYMAGIVDGEGCIGLKGERLSETKSGLTVKRAEARLEITNTDVRLIHWIVSHFGGNSRPKKPANPKAKPAFSWACGGERAHAILSRLMPYLVMKKAQAECLICFVELGSNRPTGRGAKLGADVNAARNSLVDRQHHLNRKGLAAVVNE